MNVYHHIQLISLLLLATRNGTNLPAQGFPLPQQLNTSGSAAKETEVVVQIVLDVEPSILYIKPISA